MTEYSYKDNLNSVYDPETGLYVVIDEDGYVVSHHASRKEANDRIIETLANPKLDNL